MGESLGLGSGWCPYGKYVKILFMAGILRLYWASKSPEEFVTTHIAGPIPCRVSRSMVGT